MKNRNKKTETETETTTETAEIIGSNLDPLTGLLIEDDYHWENMAKPCFETPEETAPKIVEQQNDEFWNTKISENESWLITAIDKDGHIVFPDVFRIQISRQENSGEYMMIERTFSAREITEPVVTTKIREYVEKFAGEIKNSK